MGMFSSPEEQVCRILDLNETGWKDPRITRQAIDELGDPPDCPRSNRYSLYCLCLLFDTGNFSDTLRRNWLALVRTCGRDKAVKASRVKFNDRSAISHKYAVVRQPELCWRVVELGRRLKRKVSF